MKWIIRINLVLLVLLSVATGLVKIFRMPAEMDLFAAIGFADWMTIGFGAVQLACGVALLFGSARKPAAAVLVATFVVATAALFVSGIVGFGAASLLFIVMAALAMRPVVTASAQAPA